MSPLYKRTLLLLST